MEISSESLNIMGAQSMRRRESDYNENILAAPQDFSDIVKRIDREIESIDDQLTNIKTTIEQDLKELYDSHKNKFEKQGYNTLDEFKANYQNRLIGSTKKSLYQAKEDLQQLRIEILRARISNV
jgi:flagellar biosynthesis/type III secretory pathway protein FliH